MAFVSSPLPPEQQNQLGPQGQTTPNPLSLLPPQAAQSGGSVGQGGGSSAPTAPGVGSPTQFGSSASKLSDYLQANQDQVQNMANNIAGNFGTQYANVKGGVDQAAQTFGNQVQSSYSPIDPTIVNAAASNPTDFASNPNNVAAFKSQYNDQYTGPTSFESSSPYATAQKDVTDAVSVANSIGTPAGLSTYLQNNVETNPTPGQNTLDSILLEGNQPAYQTVQQAVQPFSNLSGYLSNLTQTQDQSVQAAQQAAQQANTAAHSAFLDPTSGVVPNFENALQTELAGANTSRDAYNASINKNLSDAQTQQMNLQNAYPTDLAKATSLTGNLGNPALDKSEADRITALLNPGYAAGETALGTYLGANPITQPANIGNVASVGNYQEDAALAKLLGGDYTPQLDQSQIQSAGTFNVPAIPGNVPGMGGEIQYLSDLASLYGTPGASYWSAGGGAPGGTNLTPLQQAQSTLRNATPGSGINIDPAMMQALQRIIGGETGYGG